MGFGRHLGMLLAGAAVIATVALGNQVGGWWGAAGGAATAIGVVLLGVGLYGDAARGRKRCPRCWYDMSGTPGLVCSECGKDARTETRLLRRRVRWRVVSAGVLLFVVAAGTVATEWVRAGMRWNLAPQWMVVEGMSWAVDGAWVEFHLRTTRDGLSIDEQAKGRVAALAMKQLAAGRSSSVNEMKVNYLVKWGEPSIQVQNVITSWASAAPGRMMSVALSLRNAALEDGRWCAAIERLFQSASDRLDRVDVAWQAVTVESCHDCGVSARLMKQLEADPDPRVQNAVGNMHLFVEQRWTARPTP